MRERLSKLSSLPLLRGTKVTAETHRLRRQLRALRAESTSTEEEIWQVVELARHADRPYTLDYVERIADDWVELHGDRGRADDGALVTGIGSLDGRTVAIIGHQKGRDLKERLDRQYGMAYPEGYAKAIRTMDIADRFGFPLLSLVTFLPLAGALIIMSVRGDEEVVALNARWTALWTSLIVFLLSLIALPSRLKMHEESNA